VRSRERKVCRIMVVGGARPGGGGVAHGARRRESGGRVRRVRRSLEVRLVARRALHALAAIHLVGMTSRAGDGVMRPGQREARRAVIEG